MKIIDGGFPNKTGVWRALLLLTPTDTLGKAWHLSLKLAKANHGGLVIAVLIPNDSPANLQAARKMIKTAQQIANADDDCYPIIAQTTASSRDLKELVKRARVDLLLTNLNNAGLYNLNRLPCGVAIIRGDQANLGDDRLDNDDVALDRILIPTSGGPNTVYAFSSLLELSAHTELTALYIARAQQGEQGKALGQLRLRQALDFVDAQDRIKSRLISTDSVIDGIVNEARDGYDLVIIGASNETSIDKLIFGDIPAAIVRESKRPVMIIRQPHGRLSDWSDRLAWSWQRIIPRLNLEQRTEAYVRIRRSARPTRDFYILIALATMIAALGLIADSAAVVIGAMLVAPLMSPIVGTGLAAVQGDGRFLRLALGAVVKGLLLAIVVGMIAGLALLGADQFPNEILVRTQPGLLDLGIALFAGLAGAYALANYSAAASALPGVAISAALVPPLATVGITLINGDFEKSLGALLLFITNFIAISSATALVMLVLGFRPTQAQKARRELQARSARIALILLITIAALLAGTTYRLSQATQYRYEIKTTTETIVNGLTGGETAVSILSRDVDDKTSLLQLELTVRSERPIPDSEIEEIQGELRNQLGRPVELTMLVIKHLKADDPTSPGND